MIGILDQHILLGNLSFQILNLSLQLIDVSVTLEDFVLTLVQLNFSLHY